MKIPQSVIDEILSRTDIIDIISPRISLKRSGKSNYTALCPFHNEKTPSFNVSKENQFYYCYGCRVYGNAIGFLKAFDKMTFPEAIETLASRIGLSLSAIQDSDQYKDSQKVLLFLDTVAKYFQKQLQCSRIAQTYLKTRGLSPQIINKFMIGFAPPGWGNLLNAFGQNNGSIKQLLETGMIYQKNENRYFDRFHNRILFPIRNVNGKIIAFGGRSLDQKLPKYLNSPETHWFHKSHELYGLYETLQSNKHVKKILVVEGYMDVVALQQYGINYAVATLGTATNITHLHRLLRYTTEIIFCFDGDRAGNTAAWRALEVSLPIMRDGIKINFIFLPNGEDPDTYVRRIGAPAFENLVLRAISLADFFFGRIKRAIRTTNIADKAKFAKIVQQYLLKMPKSIFQQLMYERLSQILNISLEKLTELVINSSNMSPHTNVLSEVIPPPMRLAIALLLQNPKLLSEADIPDIYSLKLAGSSILKQLTTIITKNPNKTTGSLLEYWKEDKEKHTIAELAAIDLVPPKDSWHNELQSAFNRILEMNREQTIQQLLAKVSNEGLSLDEKKKLQQLLVERQQNGLE